MEDKIPKVTGHKFSGRYKQLYATLLDALPSSILLIDQRLRIVSANRNFLEKNQRTLSNTIGYQLKEVFPTVIIDQIDIPNRIRQVIKNKHPIQGELMTYHAPGRPLSIYSYSIHPFYRQGQVEGVFLLMSDVTEQMHLNEEVLQAERHLASIVKSASELILSINREGKILTWNKAMEKLTCCFLSKGQEYDFTDFCTNGDSKNIRLIFSRIDTHKIQKTKCVLQTAKGTLVPVSWIFSPLKNSSNQTVGIVAVGRDLTERRKFERDLHQSQKLAALGIMAGGIAHEIRNPLAICSSCAQFLIEEDGTPEFRRDCAEKIHKGLLRTSVIIENLLRYSHPSTTTQTTLVNLVSLISETITLVSYHANIKKININTSFPQKSVMMKGIATLLQQVFMNLFLNAINSMSTGGQLEINVKMAHSNARVQITDTGCGISSQEIEKIFDPFYTTSIMGQGTGLGLSVCYSIIKQHGGTIEAKSVKGKGSVFTVKLPAHFGGAKP